MKSMKIKVSENLDMGFAKGFDDNGKEYIVIGGELCLGETIVVEPYKKSNRLLINSKVNYESVDIFSHLFDKDGLIAFDKLKEVEKKSKPHNRIYQIDGFWVFPEGKIKNQVEYLYENGLISKARIKITKSWAYTSSRAPVYGVNYLDLLAKVIERQEPISSLFICDREKDFDKGVYADLFIIANFNDQSLQIQLWQIVGDGTEVLFAHGLIDQNTFKFNHFDLATHYVDPIMIPKLLYYKQRMELLQKEKWIRLDGEIEMKDIFEMIKIFFPMDYLVDEFLERPI